MMKRSEIAIRLVHLNAGWRYWAFERHTGYDVEVGLDPDGYPTQESAEAAVMEIVEEAKGEA